MAYVFVMGPCICGTLMHYNPDKVPSVRIEGVRQAVCRTCIERANPNRIKNGLEPITIHPDAYEAAEW